MSSHIECRNNEEWVGNTPTTDRHLSELRLKGVKCRLGNQAYDIHGKELPTNYMRPLIVDKSSYDLYNRIMQAELEAIRRGN